MKTNYLNRYKIPIRSTVLAFRPSGNPLESSHTVGEDFS